MKFDKIINSLLKEGLSREDRIDVLKNMPTHRNFKVVEVSLSRGYARLRSEYEVQESDLEEVCRVARNRAIEELKEEYDDAQEAEEYIREWFGEPICNEGIDVGGCPIGEEVTLLVIGDESIYWNKDIIENLDNIMEQFDWFGY